MNKQGQEIIPLKLGMTHCYLIRGGEDYLMGSLPGISRLTGTKSVMHHLDKELVEKGRRIYPAHGKPCDADVFIKYLNA